MSPQDKRNISPDTQLLAEIFPGAGSVSTRIISQNFESCTFTARPQDSDEEVLVRLQPEDSRIPSVSTIQKVAALAIPGLVPSTHTIGRASTQNGKRLDYSVITYVADAVTLESIWDDLADDQQSHIMEQITSAIKKLQSIDLSNDTVQQILRCGISSPPEKPIIPLGTTRLGFFSDMSDLVRGLIASEDWLNLVTITHTDDGGLKFESHFADIPSVSIPRNSLLALQEAVVLCHNDLEPRNILVRAENQTAGVSTEAVRYNVVAIIDWEMAGFFPFAFESFYKYLVLGSSNLYFPWYRLFKDKTACFIPANPVPEAQELLWRDLDVVLKSSDRVLTRNVGQRVQRKWIEREQLVQSEEITSGWVRNPEANEDNEQSNLMQAPWVIAGDGQSSELGDGNVHSVPGFEDAHHDVVVAIMNWVEKGHAPSELVATKFKNESHPEQCVFRQRPLCVYPAEAKYTGSGDINAAENWECRPLY